MEIRRFLMAVLSVMVLVTMAFTQISSQQGPRDYDPWTDFNDDGEIDIRDVSNVARRYGTGGKPFLAKAGLNYTSGWVNITDKAGQYFNVTHSLNSTEIMVDIQGKTTLDGEVHQRHLGLSGYLPGRWKTYGGADNDYAYSVVQTDDGGYAIAGVTYSFGLGSVNFWLVKTDAAGNAQWNKTYGGGTPSSGSAVVQTYDGGYAIAGSITSQGDFWLVKTDAAGNAQWNKTYGRTGWHDAAYSVVQTDDGGYAIAGVTYSFGAGLSDFWLVKTEVESGLAWTGSTADTVTLYRGATDPWWNFVRVRIWQIKKD